MADSDYQRLGDACNSFKLASHKHRTEHKCAYCHKGFAGFKTAKFCGAACRIRHGNAKAASARMPRQCISCGAAFFGHARKLTCCVACTRGVQRAASLAKEMARTTVKHQCRVCRTEYESTAKTSSLCSNACKLRAFKERNGVYAERATRALERETRRREREVAAVANRAAKHAKEAAEKAASAFWAAEIAELRSWRECRNCGARYRKKLGRTCSDECSRLLQSAARHAERIARRAILKAARVESVNPFKVFTRDNWRCYLCGCDTPKDLRGTYEPNAPEVEHVVPIARGGKDAYDNVRCSCRQCNGIKGDRTLEEIGGAFLGA